MCKLKQRILCRCFPIYLQVIQLLLNHADLASEKEKEWDSSRMAAAYAKRGFQDEAYN